MKKIQKHRFLSSRDETKYYLDTYSTDDGPALDGYYVKMYEVPKAVYDTVELLVAHIEELEKHDL